MTQACCKKTRKLKGIDPFYLKVKEHLRNLLPQGEALKYKEGQVLFYEKHMPYGFYLIQKGEVSLSAGPKEMGVRSADEDNILGLSHLISETAYCATGTAKSDVKVLFFPKAQVLGYLQELANKNS